MSRVPEVTVYFWVIKVLTTGMGETTSDFFIHRAGLKNTVALVGITLVTGIILAVSLALQFKAARYVAWTYWLALVMVSVFGTMTADGVHVVLGVPYLLSSVFFAIVLAAIFWAWQSSERTLSIHSIVTRQRELFYWTVVMATFALGTATGDMTAITLHFGYLSSGLLFAALIAVPAVGYRWFRLEQHLRLLVRLRRDQATRRVVRRLAERALEPGRARAGMGLGQSRLGDPDRLLRGLPQRDANGCTGEESLPALALRKMQAAFIAELEPGVEGDFPRMAVRVEEDPRIAAVERLRRFAPDPCARRPGLLDDAVDLVPRAHVVRQRDAAPAAAVGHAAILASLSRPQSVKTKPPIWKNTVSSTSSPARQPSRS